MSDTGNLRDKQLVEFSKLLSYILRHHPESIGLTLDTNGWANKDELLSKLVGAGHNFTAELLDQVVAQNSKQRFAFSDNKERIRASQGHSLQVDLGLTEKHPPDTLFHGTAIQFLDTIQSEGLKPGQRHDVHLSADVETAQNVGKRRGSSVVLVVDAKQMHMDGHKFYQSDNGVWLTKYVLAKYLSPNE